MNDWDIPKNYLCPPISGRADYIHYAADLLAASHLKNQIPNGNKIIVLDVGVGANCVYPIIGIKEYGWQFLACDIDPIAIESANKIAAENSSLHGKIDFRLQKNSADIFRGIIQQEECIDLTICNPPFHASQAEAQAGSLRKLKNLRGKKINQPILNFGGQQNELWCEGGEEKFLQNMILQSKDFAKQCLWFSSLVSKESNLKSAYKSLKNVQAIDVKTIQMGQGNKKSRILTWTFLSKEKQADWVKRRW